MKTKEELFAEWLSTKVSPNRLSDTFISIAEVDAFAQKNNIIQTSIFDVDDPVVTAKILNAINSNRIFRFLHKKQMHSISDAAHYFHKYTKEKHEKIQSSSTDGLEQENNEKEFDFSQEENLDLSETLAADFYVANNENNLKESENTHENDTSLNQSENKLNMDEVSFSDCETSYTNESIENNTKQAETTVFNEKREDNSDPTDSDSLLSFITSQGLEYVDCRDRQGCLWVIGGLDICEKIRFIQNSGFSVFFHYKDGGGKVTGGRNAWWTKDVPAQIVVDSQIVNSSEDERNKFGSWLEDRVGIQGKKMALSCMSTIDENAVKCQVCLESIFLAKDPSELIKIWINLHANAAFSDFCKENQYILSDLSSAYSKYLQFRAEGSQSTSTVQGNTQNSFNDDEKKEIKTDFINWLINKRFAEKTADSYASAILLLDNYIWKKWGAEVSIYALPGSACAEAIWRLLRNDSVFLALNKKHHSLYSAAMKQFLLFSSVQKNKDQLSANEEIKATSADPKRVMDNELSSLLGDELYGPLKRALHKNGILSVQQLKELSLWQFMNRQNLYTIATRQIVYEKIQRYFESKNNIKEQLRWTLSTNGKEFKASSCSELYLSVCEDLARKYPLRFRSIIGKPIRPGGPIAVFDKNETGRLLKMSNPVAFVSSALSKNDVAANVSWLLKECLGYTPTIVIKDAFASRGDTTVAPAKKAEKPPINNTPNPQPAPSKAVKKSDVDRIEKIVLKADLNGIFPNDLKNKAGLAWTATNQLIEQSKKLLVINGRVYHEDAFIDWEEGAEKLDTILEKLMQKNDGYVSAKQLYDYAHVEMRMFLNDNDMDSERAVYDIAKHLFGSNYYNNKEYTFLWNTHISRPSDVIAGNYDVACKFALEQGGVFAYTDLVDYFKDLGIKVGGLRAQLGINTKPNFFYYDEGLLIYSKSMGIDEEWERTMKNALGRLFDDVGDHIILRDIRPVWYDLLPDLPGGIVWTPMLLQSVLQFYGKKLGARTILAMEGQASDTLHAMLVQLDSPIQNFGDAVVSYLMENEISQRSFNAEELRSLLVESRMIRGNELLNNMPKALGRDERFSWSVDGNQVTVLV